MVLGAPVGSTLEYSINTLLVLALENSFGTCQRYFTGVLLGTLDGFTIGAGEGYLVGLSLGLPLGSPLESTHSGYDLPGTLMGAPLGLWFGSEGVNYLCFCHLLMGCHEDTCWEVGMSCLPPFGAFITSKLNSVRYCKLLELLNFSHSPTCLIPTFGGR